MEIGLICEFCGGTFERSVKQVNQSAKRNQKNYCSPICSQWSRYGGNKPSYQKQYQTKYREENKAKLKEIHRRKYARQYGDFAPVFISLRLLEDEISSKTKTNQEKEQSCQN